MKPINRFLRVSDLENQKSFILDLTEEEIYFVMHCLDDAGEPIDVATVRCVDTLLQRRSQNEIITDDGRECFTELMVY
jgi:hypothetical protein